MMLLFWVSTSVLICLCAGSVDDWEPVGCFNNFDHSALPDNFYSPTDLDVNDLWPNLKPFAEACSDQAESKNFTCFGIQYQQECYGGINASLTYNISGESRNCKVGIDGYGVGKLYTSFVYKLRPVNGNWSSWSEWAPCSTTCGKGLKKRMRNCTNPAPANGGKSCYGVAIETKSCSLKFCPVDGNWSSWSEWAPCSTTCGAGLQLRMRNCTNPAPDNGGKCCSGNGMEAKSCSLKLCPVDGNWSSWSAWAPCSKTCGVDFQRRVRDCTNPAPANDGKPCKGVAIETKSCSLKLCPVDGQWGSWNAWSACSVSCKGGVQRRRRSCNNPSPAHGGSNCIGVSMVTRMCNNGPCPVDGGWSSWNNWSTCHKTCGGGSQFRYRSCNRPRPQHNGKPCVGQGEMSQPCNTYSCPPGRKLVLCERDTGKLIKCVWPRRITLHWVHYGYISGDNECGIKPTDTCSSQNADRKLRRRCEGKYICFVKPRYMSLSAPCGGYNRYLKLYYSCT
ncbi:properdin-like [Oculina patagonica]